VLVKWAIGVQDPVEAETGSFNTAFVQTISETHPPSFPTESGQGMKLTTHLNLVPSFKYFWSYTCTPSYTFIARLIKHNKS